MIKYDIFTNDGARCAFTQRHDLNMSFKRDTNRLRVLNNYMESAREFGVDFCRMTGVTQVHGNSVLNVTEQEVGYGISKEASVESDALITDLNDVTLCTVHADCTPVFLFDSVRRVIGAVHSGWRGTVANVAGATVRAMVDTYGCKAQNVRALIGPSICMDSFEVDTDVYDLFADAFGHDIMRHGEYCRYDAAREVPKYHISVARFVGLSLCEAGVLQSSITYDSSCTFCDNDKFFSHRREGMKAGAMCAMIVMRCK